MTLLILTIAACLGKTISFPAQFEFGVSTTAISSEDNLNDIWSIAASDKKLFKEFPNLDKKIHFWSHPEKEILQAKQLGVDVFKMSLSWHRLYPEYDPDKTITQVQVLKQYLKIVKYIKSQNIKVMLTLSEQTLPQWAIEAGGWQSQKVIIAFTRYVKEVISIFKSHVDYFIVFDCIGRSIWNNYVSGKYPYAKRDIINIVQFKDWYSGEYYLLVDKLANLYQKLYREIKDSDPYVTISSSHSYLSFQPQNIIEKQIVKWFMDDAQFYFLDKVKHYEDFVGLYYNKDAIHLLEDLTVFHKRFNKPIFIMDNSIATTDEKERISHIHNSLLTLARQKQVDIKGYVYGPLTDSFDYHFGYCSQRGLIRYDRQKMVREVKDSFEFLKDLISSKSLEDKTLGKLNSLPRACKGLF